MYIKVISSIMIILCCSMIGFKMASGYTQRINNIKDLRMVMARLENEIIHYSTILSQALKNSASSIEGDWRGFFLEVANSLDEKKEISLQKIWDRSLRKQKSSPYITKAEYDIMERFGSQLGNSDRKSQEKYFFYVQEHLKIEENLARENRSKYSKMYCNLGILLGIGIAIILF